MKVHALPSNPGLAGWNEILPDRPTGKVLEANRTADWLIIGAGFTGLSAALRLKDIRPGDKIVVLDAGRVAEGPAGRNSGFMIDLPHDLTSHDYGGQSDDDLTQIRQNRTAIEFAMAAKERFDMPDEAARRCGKVNGAATARGLKQNADYARHLDALNEPAKQLSAQNMRALTGSDYYQGGLFTPGCVVLQPALYIRRLADALSLLGVDIYEESAVIGLERTNNWCARTRVAQVTAPKVILAVNGHAQSFGYYRRQLMHVYTYASMTEAMTPQQVQTLGGKSNWGVTPADPMGTTVRRVSGIGGDRIVIRNRFTYEPEQSVNTRKLKAISATHDDSFRARFPMLADLKMAHRWGGQLCLSRNNAFAFGEVAPDLFAACCQNGLGTAKGTFAGIAAAELAAGHLNENVQSLLDGPEPKGLPNLPFMTPAVRSVIRWQEVQAGKEL